MKIAVISDVHANLPALKAVLADIKAQSVEEIWHLGDFIGYAPFPKETIELLRKSVDQSIVGNYDLKVAQFPKKAKTWQKDKSRLKYFSFQWTHQNTPSDLLHYLTSIPEQLNLNIEGREVLLVHGSPLKIDEPLTPRTPVTRFEELAETARADIVLCGHSHVFFKKQIGKTVFINPGAVGRPFDSDPRASYAVLEIFPKKVEVRNLRIDYDINQTLSRMRKEKFPEGLCDSIRLGKSPDELGSSNAVDSSGLIKKALAFAVQCNYEREHSHQVAKLSLILFDSLLDLHQLNGHHRNLLHCAALLHDIGWVEGRRRHHKVSRDMILREHSLPLNSRDRALVALVARYHRRALPVPGHRIFSDLNKDEQKTVSKLAALLRIADGLDRSHISSVNSLECLINKQAVTIVVQAKNFSAEDQSAALKKSDLFQKTFGKEIRVETKKT